MKMNLTTSEKNRGIVRFLLMSMLLCLLIHPAQAQDRVTVTGRLTDTSHAPLIGASVIEQGTTNGVTTDSGTTRLKWGYIFLLTRLGWRADLIHTLM